MTQQFIDTAELAELLRVNHDTARRLCRDGRLAAAGIATMQATEAGSYRIRRADLTARIGERGVLTPDEAAARLGVNPRTVKRWLADGRLGGLQLGSGRGTLWRVSIESLEALASPTS